MEQPKENKSKVENFKELLKEVEKPSERLPKRDDGICPHCGRCPVCGRNGKRYTEPFYPYYYPYYYYYPFYIQIPAYFTERNTMTWQSNGMF